LAGISLDTQTGNQGGGTSATILTPQAITNGVLTARYRYINAVKGADVRPKRGTRTSCVQDDVKAPVNRSRVPKKCIFSAPKTLGFDTAPR
jgi:hypothetical protein